MKKKPTKKTMMNTSAMIFIAVGILLFIVIGYYLVKTFVF